MRVWKVSVCFGDAHDLLTLELMADGLVPGERMMGGRRRAF